jgi:hypothetical protein
MVMSCIVCGKALNNEFRETIKRKQQEYLKYGKVYMVYEVNKVWQYCRGEYFEHIKKTENVGEFYHISEFKID